MSSLESNGVLQNEKSIDNFVNELSENVNNEFQDLDETNKNKILKMIEDSLQKYEVLKNEDSKKNSIMQTMKKVPKLLYNTTIGEVRNGRIPILDSIHRKIYRKFINPENTNGTEAFPKKEGYYRLGGNKHSQKRNKTRKTKK
jgi:uncharacterized protein YpuA (DUF1002 family)